MQAFNEISILEFPTEYYKKIQNEIDSQGKDFILNIDEEEYIQYLVNKYELEPLNIIHDSEHIGEPKKTKVRRRNMWSEEYMADAYTFRVTYNFTGTSELFKVAPNPHQMISYDISVSGSTVSFSFTIYNQDANEFNKTKADAYHAAFVNLPGLNSNVAGIISSFESIVRSKFQTTKNSYLKENEFFAAVNIKKNPGTASVFTTPTIKKKVVVQPRVTEKKEFASEPTMAQEMYDEILKAIYDFGKNMEKKPSLYQGKGEEGLRDQFVLVMETKYEGTTATGETFNRSGKTDIILKYAKDGSNLFVAECKLWHGASEMLKAVTQLLSYLTWRDSKVALMLFVQQQSFSDVLTKISTEVSKHPNYKKAVGTRGESSFSYIFNLPQDTNKEVQLEIMAFHYDKK